MKSICGENIMSCIENEIILENYYEEFLDEFYDHWELSLAELLAFRYAKQKFFNGPHGDHEND